MTVQNQQLRLANHDCLLTLPVDSSVLLVLAHGAGAPMNQWFMEGIATQLAAHRIATLRFNFPFTSAGKKRPDPASICEASVRAVCTAARQTWPTLRLFAGGKSMGGRMTTQADASEPLLGVEGIVLVGFPLHASKVVDTRRAVHLRAVQKPMLFVQGSRDALANLALMQEQLRNVANARLYVVDQADHGFAVPKRTGKNQQDVLAEIAMKVEQFIAAVIKDPPARRDDL
jgi:uncharacterized protein